MTITSRTTATPEAYLSLLSASKFDVFGNPASMSSHLERDLLDINKAVLAGFTAAVFSVAAPCQTLSLRPVLPSAETSFAGTHLPNFQVQALRMDPLTEHGGDSGTAPKPTEHNGLIGRIVKRGLQDQKGLYAAPFKISNLKWDAVVLAGTGAFLATDRRIEKHLPGGNHQLYQNSSNVALGGLAASLAGLWAYGIKTENLHAKETGELELETLSNTFLVYAPMEFIAGRQCPGEGNGNGDFWRHHAMNTSFPGGHAMFTWAMAIGAALGFAIGTHIFHTRCDPELSPSCHRHSSITDATHGSE